MGTQFMLLENTITHGICYPQSVTFLVSGFWGALLSGFFFFFKLVIQTRGRVPSVSRSNLSRKTEQHEN